MNLSDAERVRAVLEGLGYERTNDEEEADVLGLVACSVRRRPVDRALSRADRWSSWKRDRDILTFATGCVLPADDEVFHRSFDLFFPINELPQLPDMIRGSGFVSGEPTAALIPQESYRDPRRGFWHIDPLCESTFEAYVPIQNGCDKFCSFCAVPYTRGREVSRPSGEILEEVERFVREGYGSITLLGQNVNSYGLDRTGAEMTFPELLAAIGEIGRDGAEEFRLYYTSPHPRDMTADVVEVMARYRCLAKQVHLPLQSGDDELLKRMNRKYTVQDYRRIVGQIRENIPAATLFTDIIVGFPGETVEQFENTRAAMREFDYNMAYIAMYSPRPGSLSSRWDDDVPHEEKNRRLHELSAELKRTSRRHNEAMVGTTVPVLVTGADRRDGYLSAKTEGRLIVRFASENHDLIGRFVDVTITSAADMSMEGSLVAGAGWTGAGTTGARGTAAGRTGPARTGWSEAPGKSEARGNETDVLLGAPGGSEALRTRGPATGVAIDSSNAPEAPSARRSVSNNGGGASSDGRSSDSSSR